MPHLINQSSWNHLLCSSHIISNSIPRSHCWAVHSACWHPIGGRFYKRKQINTSVTFKVLYLELAPVGSLQSLLDTLFPARTFSADHLKSGEMCSYCRNKSCRTKFLQNKIKKKKSTEYMHLKNVFMYIPGCQI